MPDGRKAMQALISWSGGKDSAIALQRARASGVTAAALLTTYDEESGRIPIHDIPLEWIERHAESLGIPLVKVPLPWPCRNEEYVRRLREVWEDAANRGIDAVVFGDIHLTDIRAFREKALAGTGLQPLFPLWGTTSADLAEEIITAGIHATITAVDDSRVDTSFVGRRFDRELLADLPAGVDPCGENGEFHTAVWL